MTETKDVSTPGADACGLRERKRRETRLRIEDHATELILERGFDQVTIDEICEKAGISRRTFFNYFDSKDQVAAGRGVPPMSAETLDRFATEDSDNIVRDVLRHLGRVLDNDPESSLAFSPDRETSLRIRARRRQIVEDTPLLSVAGMRRFDELAGDILDAMTSFLTNYPGRRRVEELTPDQEALLLTALIRNSIATGSLLYRDHPELGKYDVFNRAGTRLTALATVYSHGWDQ